MSYVAKLSEADRRILSWWADILGPLKPRCPRIFVHSPDFVVHKDAALPNNRIASVITTRSTHGPVINLLCEAPVPKLWKNKAPARNSIIGMEMMAHLALLYTAASRFLNKRVNLYIDNDTAPNTLIRGDSRDPVLASTIAELWKKSEQLRADIWIGRVSSTLNPSELPTRGGRGGVGTFYHFRESSI